MGGNGQSLPAAMRSLVGHLWFAIAPGRRAPMRRTSGVVRRFFETGVLEQIRPRAGAKHIENGAGREQGGEYGGSDPPMLLSSGSRHSLDATIFLSHRLDATSNWGTAGKVAAGFIAIGIHKKHSAAALLALFGG